MIGNSQLQASFTILLFNDLEAWERACIEPIIERLSQTALIETVWVTEAQRRFFKKNRHGNFWIVSKNWRRALDFLSAQHHEKGQLFISVLGAAQEKKKLYGLSLYSWNSKIPKTATLIVYSPLEFQFLKEIEKVPGEQLQLGLLPPPKSETSAGYASLTRKFEVGTFCDFSSESNISFFLSVAHFVTQQNSKIHFNILGRGLLYDHFSKMISELELEAKVSVVETVSETAVNYLDLFVYFPLRNYHFIPLLIAGAYGVPVVSSEIPGIENFILPDKTGILVPSFDIKAMGEKILELEKDSARRLQLGKDLNSHLQRIASVDSICNLYREILFEKAGQPQTEIRAAA